MVKIDEKLLAEQLLMRENDSHKGSYGHLLVVAGCDSMPGAASLAVSAALKSGCGLVTLHTSENAGLVSAFRNPSAMLSIDTAACFSMTDLDLQKYSAIAVGPGLGRSDVTADAFANLIDNARTEGIPMLFDADALYFLAQDRCLLECLPKGSVMTPHAGELARLISWDSDADKAVKTQDLADLTGCTIVSKGYHTKTYVPGKLVPYENTTGNPGMAKGGSGDVLTGLIGGLMARGYKTHVAAMLGVWLHGYAGDCCTEQFGMEAYNSSDLIETISLGFKKLYL